MQASDGTYELCKIITPTPSQAGQSLRFAPWGEPLAEKLPLSSLHRLHAARRTKDLAENYRIA